MSRQRQNPASSTCKFRWQRKTVGKARKDKERDARRQLELFCITSRHAKILNDDHEIVA